MGHWMPKSNESQILMRSIEAELQARVPVLLWGPPGIGKTSFVRSLAQTMGYDLQVVIGARKNPDFVEGLPLINYPKDENGVDKRPEAINVLPDWFIACLDNPRTIVYADEFNGASEDVQSSLLSVYQDREIDGVRLPDETLFIAAANDVEHAANGQYLAPAMANRWAHHNFFISVPDYIDGLAQNFGDEPNYVHIPSFTQRSLDEESARTNAAEDKREWTDRFWKESARVASYLNGNAGAIDIAIPSDPAEASKAFASRRTWGMLVKALAGTSEDETNVRAAIAESIIGRAMARAFNIWDTTFNIPPLEELLAQTYERDWSEITTDAAYAFLGYALNRTTRDNHVDVGRFYIEIGKKHRGIGYAMSLDYTSRTSRLCSSEGIDMDYGLIGDLAKVYEQPRAMAGLS